MIDIQHEEFVCYRFIHSVFVVMAMTEGIANELGSPSRVITSDYLMTLHFETWIDALHIVLDDHAMVAAFKRLYPTRLGLLDIAVAQCESLERLHTVRTNILLPHLDPANPTDVHNYHDALMVQPAAMTKADRAQMHGLTIPQYDDWASQVDENGYVHLSMAERDTLRAAIVAEHPAPKPPKPSRHPRQHPPQTQYK
jgi:hypothetical protein